jgi:hypothetical protein
MDISAESKERKGMGPPSSDRLTRIMAHSPGNASPPQAVNTRYGAHCKIVSGMRPFSIQSISFVLCLSLAGLTGCSSEPAAPAAKKEEKKPEPPAGPVTGQSAVFSMYQVARAWSGDVVLLRVENIPITEVKAEDGKYGAWRAVFVSPGRNQKRSFTYSVVDADGGLFKGVRPGAEQPYASSNLMRTFPILDFKIDSLAALEAAKKVPETEGYIKKNPEVPVQYIAEWPSQLPAPAWRVLWGQSVGTSNYSVYIDAITGKFLKKAR